MAILKLHNTNDKSEIVNFQTALLRGMGSKYGLYMMDRKDIPKLSMDLIKSMSGTTYSEIAFKVLNPFLKDEIPEEDLRMLLNDAYREDIIPTKIQHVTGNSHLMWLTNGPTYSFKDYAARFYGRTLNHFLKKEGLHRSVIVATSGDTGGAVADALHGLSRVQNIVFFPKGEISERQRRQMTTLFNNVYAFEVNGNFDVCQALAKYLLGDKKFAGEITGDEDNFTSANSISIGRLLPQAVYPFFAYSTINDSGKGLIASVPSGNFGDMMGTVVAKEMGLPISRILVGLNPNKPFMDLIHSGEYKVKDAIRTPSSAMKVSHPSNLARLVDFYGGHMYDKRDPKTNKVIEEGIITKMPDLNTIREDFFVHSISNEEHYKTMKDVHDRYGIIIEPHGAVGWATLDAYLGGIHELPAVVYETADPGKFPDDVMKAIGISPDVPEGMAKQKDLAERIYSINSDPIKTKDGLKLSNEQIVEAQAKIREIYL